MKSVRNHIVLFSALIFCSVCFGGTYSGGSGTAEDPYRIATDDQLIGLGLNTVDYDKCFVLMEDLDLVGKNLVQAVIAKDTDSSQSGFQGPGFSGCFDGNGHVIRNLKIDANQTTNSYLGLFGQVESTGVVKNLTLNTISLTTGTQSSYFGGIVANCLGHIDNCHTSGTIYGSGYSGGIAGNLEGGQIVSSDSSCTVYGDYYVGGLVGQNTGMIDSCQVSSFVSGIDYIGGLIGRNSSGTIQHSSSRGAVNGTTFNGGLIGSNSGGSIKHAHSSASVRGRNYSGGLIGISDSSVIEDCYAAGSVTLRGSSNSGGGFIGMSYKSTVSRCYSIGSVRGDVNCYYLGGLIGDIYDNMTIEDSFAWGSVTGGWDIGGLVGSAVIYENMNITLRNCYATGSVLGDTNIGGLVGIVHGINLVNSYSTGFVQGKSYSGGLIGRLFRGTITGSFWDVTASGMATSAGGMGKTTAEMMTMNTYTGTGWDFLGEATNGQEEIWRMCADGVDYPRLSWEFLRLGDFTCPNGVGMDDLVYLAGRWLSSTPATVGAADASRDGIVNLPDLAILSEYWGMQQIPDPYFVLHLKMDGDYSDSASGYPVVKKNNPVLVGEDEARVGTGAVKMLGYDQFEIPGFKGIVGASPRTCAAWIKTTNSQIDIVQWGDNSGDPWSFGVMSGCLAVDNYFVEPTRVNTGQWVHVAAVVSQGINGTCNLSLYVNGIPGSTWTSLTSIDTEATTDVKIGTHSEPGTFPTWMDDIRIYSRALTTEEIGRLAEAPPVFAGRDQVVRLPNSHQSTLTGQYTGAWIGTTVHWEQVRGSAGAVINDPTALTTKVDFSREGEYVFRLTVSDGTSTASDEVVVTVTNGEVGYWKFDGNFLDVFYYEGTPFGDPVFVNASNAKMGTGAIEFDGDDSVVIFGFPGISGTKARTTMAWIKTTGTVGPIVCWGDMNTAGGLWEMRVNIAGQLRMNLNGCGINGVMIINTGQWVHVAAVLPEGATNAADVLLYVNGVLETGGAVTAGAINTGVSAAMRIGADEASHYFTGLIDDVRVYDRALTAEEILAAMGQ